MGKINTEGTIHVLSVFDSRQAVEDINSANQAIQHDY